MPHGLTAQGEKRVALGQKLINLATSLCTHYTYPFSHCEQKQLQIQLVKIIYINLFPSPATPISSIN